MTPMRHAQVIIRVSALHLLKTIVAFTSSYWLGFGSVRPVG